MWRRLLSRAGASRGEQAAGGAEVVLGRLTGDPAARPSAGGLPLRAIPLAWSFRLAERPVPLSRPLAKGWSR